jgi:regulatory protein
MVHLRLVPPLEEPEVGGPDADPEAVARHICIKLLAGSPKSRAQLAEALAKRYVPDDVATSVLDNLTAAGLIDDGAFAAGYVSSARRRGLSNKALGYQLRERGVAPDVIDEVLERDGSEGELEAARQVVARELRARSYRAVTIRSVAIKLFRKGYARQTVDTVLSEVRGRLPIH